MGILWCGNEDVDFQDQTYSGCAGGNRSGFGRLAMRTNGSNPARSFPFKGGAITAGWVSALGYYWQNTTSAIYFGIGKNSNNRGWFIGASATNGKLALWSFTGSWTEVATESGFSLNGNGIVVKADMEITNFGTSGTIKLYWRGVLILTYANHDLTLGGTVNDLDCFLLMGTGAYNMGMSEFIVADEDTRSLGLATHPPDAAGDQNQWTGLYSVVDDTTIDDNDMAYVNSADQEVDYNLGPAPSGTYKVIALKVVARALKSSDASVGTLKLGARLSSTSDLDSGQTLTTGWATYDRMMTTLNGSNVNTLSMTDLGNLQSAMKSAA